ncbi:MAG: hypothetical protein LBU51_04950 [Bacteroidales bacterium]|jgi:hypothetical protein|nr:hypothetical protein [Bacteroidales bacterium]
MEIADNVDEVDNSGLSYSDKSFYVRLNGHAKGFEEHRDYLENSKKSLSKKYPKLFENIGDMQPIEYLMKMVFTEGFPIQMYVRNLSYFDKNNNLIQLLAVRPVKGVFLSDNLPNTVPLIFKGHTARSYFISTSVLPKTPFLPHTTTHVSLHPTPLRRPV